MNRAQNHRGTMSAEANGMTPYRDFRDDDDRPWTAWDVVPSWGERRLAQRRRPAKGAPPHGEERRRADRRVHHGIRISLTPALTQGWLAFESGLSRRRLVPIPLDWHLLSEEQLRELWRAAEQLPQRRRLIEWPRTIRGSTQPVRCGGNAYHRTAAKCAMLPPSTNRCQTAWL